MEKSVVQPKVKGFICITSHPEGCYKNVDNQISFVESKAPYKDGPKNVLVIGASQGFGLSSRIVSAFGFKANTLGIFFEKEPKGKRPASTGWYSTRQFEKRAKEKGLYSSHINGDAFSFEVKDKAIEEIKKNMGKIDLVVYSIASPKRTDPTDGVTYSSVLKTIGKPFTGKTVNTATLEVTAATLEPGTDEEINNTVKVMGGQDWKMWIDALSENGVLADNATTVAYSYIGPDVTYPMYRSGTIGKAKDHLEETAHILNKKLLETGGRAFVSVNKALVTQASSAIPIIPLYISALFKVMKKKGVHEGTIEQMQRLFSQRLYSSNGVEVDEAGRIRVDDLEMREDVQEEVQKIWDSVTTENLSSLTDIKGYKKEFMNLFGFEVEGVDYEKEVQTDVELSNLI